MDYRKIATRILFYSLGIAALAGVLALILPNASGVIGRLVVTAIITAITASLLLFAIQRLEVKNTRLFGASNGIFTCSIYACTIVSIWIELLIQIGGNSLAEKFGVSVLLLSGCGILISLGLLAVPHTRIRISGFVLSGIWSICLIIWLLTLWILSNTPAEPYAGYIAFPLQTLFPIIVLCFIRRPLPYLFIAASFAIASCVLAQIAMFTTQGHIEKDETLFLLTLITGGAGALLGVANIIQYRASNYAIRWAENLSLVVASFAIVTFCIVIWYEMHHLRKPDLLTRLAVSSGILSSTSILGLLVGQMLRASVFTTFDGSGLEGICPRCKTTMHIPRGKSHCTKCGLRMKLFIESPHCRSCGYDITKTPEVDACPECGQDILVAKCHTIE